MPSPGNLEGALSLLPFLLGLALLLRLKGAPLGALGAFLNLLWFIYQTGPGFGVLAYLRGLGVGLFLAAGYGKPSLAWALTPWPLLFWFWPRPLEALYYLPALGEGLTLGALLYLAGFRRR